MSPEEITHELRILHEQVLVCGRCKRPLVPSDRGWRCETIGHRDDVDNDQQAQVMLMLKTTCRPRQALECVRRYRLFAAGKTIAEREAVFARPR